VGRADQAFLEGRLPEVLKDWKPAGPEHLPAPDWLFTEMEAAKAWGIPWPDWKRLRLQERVEMTGHELEKAKRDGYISEQISKEGKEGTKQNSWRDMRKQMFQRRKKPKK
jgi:hypothetical protein